MFGNQDKLGVFSDDELKRLHADYNHDYNKLMEICKSYSFLNTSSDSRTNHINLVNSSDNEKVLEEIKPITDTLDSSIKDFTKRFMASVKESFSNDSIKNLQSRLDKRNNLLDLINREREEIKIDNYDALFNAEKQRWDENAKNSKSADADFDNLKTLEEKSKEYGSNINKYREENRVVGNALVNQNKLMRKLKNIVYILRKEFEESEEKDFDIQERAKDLCKDEGVDIEYLKTAYLGEEMNYEDDVDSQTQASQDFLNSLIRDEIAKYNDRTNSLEIKISTGAIKSFLEHNCTGHKLPLNIVHMTIRLVANSVSDGVDENEDEGKPFLNLTLYSSNSSVRRYHAESS